MTSYTTFILFIFLGIAFVTVGGDSDMTTVAETFSAGTGSEQSAPTQASDVIDTTAQDTASAGPTLEILTGQTSEVAAATGSGPAVTNIASREPPVTQESTTEPSSYSSSTEISITTVVSNATSDQNDTTDGNLGSLLKDSTSAPSVKTEEEPKPTTIASLNETTTNTTSPDNATEIQTISTVSQTTTVAKPGLPLPTCKDGKVIIRFKAIAYNATYKNPADFEKTVAELWKKHRNETKPSTECAPERKQRRNADDGLEITAKKEGDDIVLTIDEHDATQKDTKEFAEKIKPVLASELQISEENIKIGFLSDEGDTAEGSPQWQTIAPILISIFIMIAVLAVVGVSYFICVKCRRTERHPEKQRIKLEEGTPGSLEASNPLSDAEIVRDEGPMQEVANPAVTPNGGGQHLSKDDEDNGWVVPLEELSKAEKEKPEIENTKL